MSTPMASIHDTLNYHKMDRRLYERVMGLGRASTVARNIIALWMWLELIDVNVVHFLKDVTIPNVLLNFIKEAEAILDIIRQDSPPSDDDALVAIPFTADFVSEPFNLRFFYFNREVVVRGLTKMLDGVGTLIFNDHLSHMLNTYERTVSFAREQGMRLPTMPQELAQPYNSDIIPPLEDYRSLFITFSIGFALSREEIAEYFNEKMGECVDRVMLERRPTRATPMYGRIVFKSQALIDILLNGERLAKFTIRGTEIWGRKYIPRIGRTR
ncbi:hypothetical protein J5N97_003495 [Dioscorea zingiberensis]|uniref:RRM domain-containing protein n=1 Tax=Dioscorea zingiberensis TaxID=325984 RepID=A0A9D5D5M2_9LILI|nr:hypothetical protein J5N97_003495 [Dioscorea zingiberensis]